MLYRVLGTQKRARSVTYPLAAQNQPWVTMTKLQQYIIATIVPVPSALEDHPQFLRKIRKLWCREREK